MIVYEAKDTTRAMAERERLQNEEIRQSMNLSQNDIDGVNNDNVAPAIVEDTSKKELEKNARA